MDRGAWQATSIRLQRVGHDLVTKQHTQLRQRTNKCVCFSKKPEYIDAKNFAFVSYEKYEKC